MNMKTACNGIQHLGIPVSDMDKSVEFFEKIGFDLVYSTMDGNDRVNFLKLGNLMLETFEMNPVSGKNGAIDHVALDVNDIEECFAWAKKEGLPVVEDEIQFLPFWENGVKFFNVCGPDSVTVEFSQML